jgi:hypothetical protein
MTFIAYFSFPLDTLRWKRIGKGLPLQLSASPSSCWQTAAQTPAAYSGEQSPPQRERELWRRLIRSLKQSSKYLFRRLKRKGKAVLSILFIVNRAIVECVARMQQEKQSSLQHNAA